MLEVHVKGRVWSKLGAMVAYRGNLRFVREGAFEGGLGRFVTKMVSGEAAPAHEDRGHGHRLPGRPAEEASPILRLQRDARRINVNGNDLLAFEDTVQLRRSRCTGAWRACWRAGCSR